MHKIWGIGAYLLWSNEEEVEMDRYPEEKDRRKLINTFNKTVDLS